MNDRRTIGLFGGSFDPPHAGHRQVSLTALNALKLDAVWWLPTPQNPLKPHAPDTAEKRLEACREYADHPRITVCDIEMQHGLTHSIDTVRLLQKRHPRHRFVWIMGADAWASFHRWKDWRTLAETLPIAVHPREGATLKAASCPAGVALAGARKSSASSFAAAPAPAWILLSGAHHPASSSALRDT